MVAIWLPVGLYRVVAPLSFPRSISLASLFTKNNHNTDPCLPANDQKMVLQTLVFNNVIFSMQHSMIFRLNLIYKKCLPVIETSMISKLDIALAVPKKIVDFLDKRRKRSRNDRLLSTRKHATTVSANSPLWKRVIAWERSRAASGYGIIWGDADRNKQEGI